MENKEERRKKLFDEENTPPKIREQGIKLREENIKESARAEYIIEWEKEQERLKAETPEEKTFRNYKCKFCWQYLFQFGFTKFFGTEDWKWKRGRGKEYETFLDFDKKIWEVDPERVRNFTKETEQYFRDNPEEIWVNKEILHKYLPKGYQSMPKLKCSVVNAWR